MRKIIALFFILILFIIGCSKNPSFDKMDKEKMHELSITYTKKSDIITKNGKIILVITYLNPIKTDIIDENSEMFLMGVYNNNEINSDKNNSFFSFYLNNKIYADDIEHLDKNSLYLKLSPMINRWSEYYIIKFPKQRDRKLILTFEDKEHHKTTLTFEKEL